MGCISPKICEIFGLMQGFCMPRSRTQRGLEGASPPVGETSSSASSSVPLSGIVLFGPSIDQAYDEVHNQVWSEYFNSRLKRRSSRPVVAVLCGGRQGLRQRYYVVCVAASAKDAIDWNMVAGPSDRVLGGRGYSENRAHGGQTGMALR